MLLPGILAEPGDDDGAAVHRGLQDVDELRAVVDELQGLHQRERSRIAAAPQDVTVGRLGRAGVQDGDIESLLLIEALLQGGIIPGELRLRRPLGHEHETVLCGQDLRNTQQDKCKGQDSEKSHSGH